MSGPRSRRTLLDASARCWRSSAVIWPAPGTVRSITYWGMSYLLGFGPGVSGRNLESGARTVMGRSPHGDLYHSAVAGESGSGVRLAELLVALSMATDLGLGQPRQHMLRSTRTPPPLGERLGLSDAQLQTLYDVSLLTYVGCPVYGNEAAALFGDDIEFRARVREVDLAGFPAMAFMLRQAGAGGSARHRAARAATIMATGGKGVIEQMADHCAAAGVLASRIGLSDETRAGVEQTYTRWDGKGAPAGLGGEQLSLATRIAQVAEVAEVLNRTSGVGA